MGRRKVLLHEQACAWYVFLCTRFLRLFHHFLFIHFSLFPSFSLFPLLSFSLLSVFPFTPGARPSPDIFREINLHVDTGAEAADYSEIKRKEKLSDLEVELLRLENIVKDLMSELEYLHKAEFEMRDTNEDANERVKWFSVFSMVLLIGVGLWQIWYLQKFFQSKVCILSILTLKPLRNLFDPSFLRFCWHE